MSYCKLYIDSNENRKQIQNLVDQTFLKLEHSRTRYIQTLSAVVYNNDNHNLALKVGKKFCPTETTYYVEIGDENEDEDFDKPEFEKVIIDLISELRKQCEYVVASCNFEQLVIEKTGWNWTESHPYFK